MQVGKVASFTTMNDVKTVRRSAYAEWRNHQRPTGHCLMTLQSVYPHPAVAARLTVKDRREAAPHIQTSTIRTG